MLVHTRTFEPFYDEFEPGGAGIPPVSTEPAAQPAPEFDDIVYNGETIKLPVSERKTFLQKGYNYDKVKTKADTYESALQKAARITGYDSVDAYLQAVEKAEKEAEAKQYQQAGIEDPKAIEKLLNEHPVIKQTQEYFNKARIADEKAALKEKRFFKDLEPDIDKVLASNPTLSPKFVYEYMRGQRFEELLENETKAAQKKGVEDFINQGKRGTESSDAPAVDEKTLDFTADEKAWADRRVKQGTYKNLKEAHDFLRGKAGVKMR
jgi:hypothetical protein